MNTNVDKPKLKSFIRCPGNKSRHIKKISPYLPNPGNYDRYIEPFLGSGAMFLALQPKKFIINDISKDCINCWKSIRDYPDYIIKEFKAFGKKFKPLSKEDKIEWCREITAGIEEQPYDINRAIDFMLMKHCAFMGTIQRDKFYFYGLCSNITKHKLYCFLTNHENIKNLSRMLNNTTIHNKDYKKILDKTKHGDFVFLDPPYVEEELEYGFKYNKEEKLDNNFLKEIKIETKKLDKKGVLWMMTQANTKEVRDLFKNYNIVKYPVYRAYSKKKKNRTDYFQLLM